MSETRSQYQGTGWYYILILYGQMTYRPLLWMIFFLTGTFLPAKAQDVYDSLYYKTYPRHITGRLYFSQKYTSVLIRNRERDYSLLYVPNTSLNMGIGATYKWATINIAYGFRFLNSDDDDKGRTKYLDMQFHRYGRKLSIDLLGQFYNGFYLSPRGYATLPDEYYKRPDMRVRLVGASAQYILNYRRFSYRAAFLQNEWQQKSAGSFLFGFEASLGNIKGDSTLIPRAVDESVADSGLRLLSFIELGPSAGYAYTLVYKKNFFLTASGSVSMDFGWHKMQDLKNQETVFGLNPNTWFRVSAGYNSTQWAFNILWVTNAMRLPNFDIDKVAHLRTGNVRVNGSYRFPITRKVKKYLKVIDEVDEEINNR